MICLTGGTNSPLQKDYQDLLGADLDKAESNQVLQHGTGHGQCAVEVAIILHISAHILHAPNGVRLTWIAR